MWILLIQASKPSGSQWEPFFLLDPFISAQFPSPTPAHTPPRRPHAVWLSRLPLCATAWLLGLAATCELLLPACEHRHPPHSKSLKQIVAGWLCSPRLLWKRAVINICLLCLGKVAKGEGERCSGVLSLRKAETEDPLLCLGGLCVSTDCSYS